MYGISSSNRIFYSVTVKKNVHFRPGIIHFFLAGEWTFFFIASYFYSKHPLMGEGGEKNAKNV